LTAALGVKGEVSKTRHLYMVGRTRIHCDRVAELGDFLELEVKLAEGEAEADGAAEARRIMGVLGVEDKDLLSGAYMDMLLKD